MKPDLPEGPGNLQETLGPPGLLCFPLACGPSEDLCLCRSTVPTRGKWELLVSISREEGESKVQESTCSGDGRGPESCSNVHTQEQEEVLDGENASWRAGLLSLS